VTHADVLRLSESVGDFEAALAFLEFLAPDEVDAEPDSFVELSIGRRLLVLAQARSSDARQERADCVFWRENAGCSVYPRRPGACRTYPFEPETAGVAPGRVHLRIHPDAMCDSTTGLGAFTEEGSCVEAADDEPTRELRGEHAGRERELSDYVRFVSDWNRRQNRRRLAGRRPEGAEMFLRALGASAER
jgi:Fe-S-cluster containining protein